MNEIKNEALKKAEKTIGFAEAENKKSFMTGVSVGFDKAEEIFSIDLEKTKNSLSISDKANDELRNDLKTLVSILNKYSYL